MLTFLRICFLLGTLISSTLFAAFNTPEPLKPWVSWALFGTENHACPTLQNTDNHLCVWSGLVQLQANQTGMHFQQQAKLFAKDWVAIPGDEDTFPVAVKVNGKDMPVFIHSGSPSLILEAGDYQIEGDFTWQQTPARLSMPFNVGLVWLQSGKTVSRLNFIDQNHVALSADAGITLSNQKPIELRVIREIIDGVPVEIETWIRISSGTGHTQLQLPAALLKDTAAVSLNSTLPVWLNEAGVLTVETAPGIFWIQLKARELKDNMQFTASKASAVWPGEEYWVVKSDDAYRSVRLDGGQALDPEAIAFIPPALKNLPLFRVKAEQSVNLVEMARGEQQQTPILRVSSTRWLDFAGKSYTDEERVSAELKNYLLLSSVFDLNYAAVNQAPRMLFQKLEGSRGLMLSPGNSEATTRLNFPRYYFSMPLNVWDTNLQSWNMSLHLPPAWRVLTALGVDAKGTWLSEWTLLQWFVVLLISFAAGRLFNAKMGIVTFVMMLLTYQEQNAPQLIWFYWILGIALLRVLPEGKFRMVTAFYTRVVFLIFAGLALFFTALQVQSILYPGLAWESVAKTEPPTMRPQMLTRYAGATMKNAIALDAAMPIVEMASQTPLTLNENQRISTGVARPVWQRQVATFRQEGSIAPGDTFTLILMPPTLVALFKVLGLLLMFVVAAKFLCQKKTFSYAWFKTAAPQAWVWALLICIGLLASITPAYAFDMPDDKTLQTLKERLQPEPFCKGDCLTLSQADFNLSDDTVTVTLIYHLGSVLSVALPLQADDWLPNDILVDGTRVVALAKQNANLNLALTPGVHIVKLMGPIAGFNVLRFPMPIKPKNITVSAVGFVSSGLDESGHIQSDLLSFKKTSAALSQQNKKTSIVPFYQITRILRLDKDDWRVQTLIRRIAPMNVSTEGQLALLAGEIPEQKSLSVKAGQVFFSMPANQSFYQFESHLPLQKDLNISVPGVESASYRYQVQVGEDWQLQYSGVPLSIKQGTHALWFLPKPNETLHLTIGAQKPVVPRWVTIEKINLVSSEAKDSIENDLTFMVRASMADFIHLQFPIGTELRSIDKSGESQVLSLKEERLSLVMQPGEQTWHLKFNTPANHSIKMATPKIEFSEAPENIILSIIPKPERWIIWVGGPTWGPVMLFHGLLVAVLVCAFVLGRLRITPLSTGSWFMLGIGLLTANLLMSIFVILTILALSAREKVNLDLSRLLFNTMQILLIILLIVAGQALFEMVSEGLLGQPDMHLYAGLGNMIPNDVGNVLTWYQDKTLHTLPSAYVIGLPLSAYRALMLVWALWLASLLTRHAKWAYNSFSKHGLWRQKKNLHNV